MRKFRHAPWALACAASLTLVACDSGANDDASLEAAAEEDSKNLASAIDGDSTFASAIDAAGLGEVLAGPEPYTVLAPSDAAFDALPAGALDGLMAEDAREQLGQVLTYHMMPGTILADDIANAIEAGGGSTELPTYGGGTITARMDGDTIVLSDGVGGEARVTGTTDGLENGVVHQIDAVLMPN